MINIRPKNKAYVHITFAQKSKADTLHVKTPKQITYNSTLHKNQIHQSWIYSQVFQDNFVFEIIFTFWEEIGCSEYCAFLSL